MSEREDGGPAFPQQAVEHPSGWVGAAALHGDEGASLLDYFAGQAMQGDLAAQDGNANGYGEFTPKCFPGLAERAYAIAGAMLAERRKRMEGK